MALEVYLLGYTTFNAELAEALTGWSTDAGGGQALAEFAGRACYQSWNKPNAATATNNGYLAHILDVGHLSVLEHSTATFYITGVSRSLTHELIRHRHLSYSQLSQRFVDESDAEIVVPPNVEHDKDLVQDLWVAMHKAQVSYENIVNSLIALGYSRKQSREAARAVLPNMTETKIVVSGNYRAWLEVIARRIDPAADAEIQRLAAKLLENLKLLAPNVFDHV